MTETALQKSVIQWLDLTKPDAFWFHVPNESKSHVAHRVKMKAMGVVPGVADLVFILPGGRVGFIELKFGKGRQSIAQQGFEHAVTELGAFYRQARCIEEVAQALWEWGVLRQCQLSGPS